MPVILGVAMTASPGAVAATSPLITKACANAIAHLKPVRPKLLPSAPPARLTSTLGVLRRPATTGDALPRVAGPLFDYSVVWTRYVRLLAIGQAGTRYYLIPGIWVDLYPPACRKTLPAKLRKQEAQADREQSHGSVSLEAVSQSGAEGQVPLTSEAINRGDVYIEPARHASTTPAYGVVPDGVASVTVRGRAGAPVSAEVINNFFLMRVPVHLTGPKRDRAEVFTVDWRAADGATLKTFSAEIPSSPGSFSGSFFGSQQHTT